MAGRRRSFEGLAAGVGVITAEMEERRKFNQRLQEAGIKGEVEAGRARFDLQTGRYVQEQPQDVGNLLRGQGGVDFLSEPDTEISQTIKTPQGTFTMKRSGPPRPKELSPRQRLEADIISAQGQLQQAQANVPQLTSQLTGQPLPSFGISERVLSARPENIQRAVTAPVQQAQGRLQGFQQQAGQLRQAFPTAASFNGTEVPDPQIAQRIETLRRGGMSDEQITSFLIEKGIDPATYGL